MLTPPSSDAVAKWRDMSDVILLDLDSIHAPEGSVLDGLAAKFEREGFAGQLWFVKGGQKAVQGMNGLSVSGDDGDDKESQVTPTALTGPGGLKIGRLGKLAFQQGESRTEEVCSSADVWQSPPEAGVRARHSQT